MYSARHVEYYGPRARLSERPAQGAFQAGVILEAGDVVYIAAASAGGVASETFSSGKRRSLFRSVGCRYEQTQCDDWEKILHDSVDYFRIIILRPWWIYSPGTDGSEESLWPWMVYHAGSYP